MLALALETIYDQHEIERITKGLLYDIIYKYENSDNITVEDNQGRTLILNKRHFEIMKEEI